MLGGLGLTMTLQSEKLMTTLSKGSNMKFTSENSV